VSEDDDPVRRAIVDSYRIVCICNKIRKGSIEKAMRGGARSFEDIKRRTRAGTGDCKAERCGPVIREMLARKADRPG
jgi:NAD(P)H-nitrite reductase large subunit